MEPSLCIPTEAALWPEFKASAAVGRSSRLPRAPLASSLAETLLRQRSGNLLFRVPTLGRKQFGEGNCKLAFVVKPPAPGPGPRSLSPRLPPPALRARPRARGRWDADGPRSVPTLLEA